MFFFDEKCSLKKKSAKVQGSQVDYNLTENFKSSVMLLTPKSVLPKSWKCRLPTILDEIFGSWAQESAF